MSRIFVYGIVIKNRDPKFNQEPSTYFKEKTTLSGGIFFIMLSTWDEVRKAIIEKNMAEFTEHIIADVIQKDDRPYYY